MFKDVEEKLKRKNKVLFNRDSKCLEDLIELIKRQKHRTLVLWAFECVKSLLKIFEEKYGLDSQFLHAYSIKFNKIDGILSYLSNKKFCANLSKKEHNIINLLSNSL